MVLYLRRKRTKCW